MDLVPNSFDPEETLNSEDLLRRKYCAEARLYGTEKALFGQKSRRITVFLNPAASGGGARKLFEKNAAPLLYLAGLDVNVVKTEYEGQVKEFMTVFEKKDTDAIVVAGGNGALLETITGLMRKEDKTFRQAVAIGVIPVGYTSKFGRYLFGEHKAAVRRMLDSAMAVVKGHTEKMDILKIQGEDGKAIYTLHGLEAGEFRDAEARKSKYWYMGPLKARFTYLRSTFKDWPPVLRGTLEYVLATEENEPKPKMKTAQPEAKPASRSWLSFLYRAKPQPPTLPAEEEEEDEDYEDNETVKKDISTVELTLATPNLSTDQKLKAVEFSLGPSDLTKGSFIKEGLRRIKEPAFKLGCETNENLLVRKVKFNPEIPEGKEVCYSIDGEKFEAMPIEVTLQKKRVSMYTTQPEDGR